MAFRMTRLVPGVLLAVMLATPVLAAITWRNATTSTSAQSVMAGLINTEHTRVCGKALSSDSRLVWMSRYRATDMVLNGYFGHVTPTGKRVWDFMAKAGIGFAAAGEILAWNSYPDDLSPAAAYRQFMDSSSHRALIRSCTYTRFGVGNYKAGAKRMYAVLFIRP